MQLATEKLSVKEKAGYSLGVGVANYIFQTIVLPQLRFSTSISGIRAGVIRR